MNRNTNLFLAIADTIERHPEMHVQEVWAEHRNDCGTAACIAGHAVMTAKPHWLDQTMPEWAQDTDKSWGLRLEDEVIRAEGVYPNWENVGANVLGLHDFEARILFDGSASPRDQYEDWPTALRAIANGAEIDEVIQR